MNVYVYIYIYTLCMGAAGLGICRLGEGPASRRSLK